MHAQTLQAPRQRRLTPLIVAIAAASSSAAWADEPTPFFIGVKQAFVHDSNVYRVPDGDGDYYSITTLLGGFDQKISRQRLYANANVGYNKYKNATTLDNTSYGVVAGWDWATIENLSGNFNASANQNLASFDGNNNVPTTTRNLVKTDQLAASIRWGGEGLLTLEGSYAHSRVRYSDPAYLSSESSADTASIGGYYRAGASLRLGLALRGTRTDNPYAVLKPGVVNIPPTRDDYESNRTTGDNVDLLADWRYSDQTSVNARVSYTRQRNSRPEVEDFSGVTGGLTATYAPTAKLKFELQLARDAGSNATFFNVVNAPTGAPAYGLTQGSQTTDVVALGLRYEATAKVNVNAGYRYRHAKIVRSSTGTATEQSDNLHGVTLGVTYDFARSLQFGCDLGHENRDVTGTPAYAYKANTVGCSVQFLLK